MKLEDLSRVQVYSASRHLEDARKAPASVSIITADEIRRYGWRTLGEALRRCEGSISPTTVSTPTWACADSCVPGMTIPAFCCWSTAIV